jgi:hypothetical protein
VFFKLIDKEKIRANHFYNTGEELPDDMLEILYQQGEGNFNQGGRVGMFAGGSLIGKGIMEAAKLAQKGVKPFGAKQTYKQNVKMVGMDEFQEAMKKEFDLELYKINKVRGQGNPEAELFDLYEDVLSGQRYSMLPDKTRQEMMDQIEDAMRDYNVDGGDFQNFMGYMADEYGVSRDVQNNPTKFLKDVTESAKIIPFKPKTKKANGGTVPPLKGPASDGMGSLFRRK